VSERRNYCRPPDNFPARAAGAWPEGQAVVSGADWNTSAGPGQPRGRSRRRSGRGCRIDSGPLAPLPRERASWSRAARQPLSFRRSGAARG